VRRLVAALSLGLAVLVQMTPVGDNDLWWLLETGEYMVATRTLPTTDPFTWTAQGAPWVNHAWGFELVLYGIYAAAGLGGLIALQALFALATFAVMSWTLSRDGIPAAWGAVLIIAGALITKGFWAPRPQLVTYLGLAILWAIVREYREGRGDRLRWLPVLTLVWVNLHGGFLVGLAVLGLAAVGQAADGLFDRGEDAPPSRGAGRLALIWLACLGTALLNPFHVRALLFPLQVLGDLSAKDFIIEWFSPAFQSPELRLFEGLLLFVLAAMPGARRPPRLGDIALLVALVHLTLDATRNIPLFVIVLTPLAARLGVDAWERARDALHPDRRLTRWPACAAAALAIVLGVAFFRDLGPQLAPMLRPRWGLAGGVPAGAADFLLANRLPGHLFNEYGWGGYLTWRLFPHYRVFIDGRIAVFPRDVREDFLAVNNGQPDWLDILDRRRIDLILIRTGTALASLLREAPGWTVAYQDPQAIIFQRRAGART
jgi:hypothetical protein